MKISQQYAGQQARGGKTAPVAWRAWCVFVLVALLVQANMVQSHVHPGELAAPASLVAQASPAGPSDNSLDGGAPKSVDYCAFCWEAAMAGHFIMPNASLVTAPVHEPGWYALATLTAWQLPRPNLGWSSRAPPR